MNEWAPGQLLCVLGTEEATPPGCSVPADADQPPACWALSHL